MAELERIYELKEKYRLRRQEGEEVQEIPITMFPSVYCEEKIKGVFELQGAVNGIVQRLAGDREMLGRLAEGKLEIAGARVQISTDSDEMYRILENIRRARKDVRKVSGLFIRTDYIENLEGVFKQVEINTVSCSFVMSGQNVNKLHQELAGAPEWVAHFEKSVGQRLGELLISEAPEKFLRFVRLLSAAYEKTHGSRGCFVILDVDSSAHTKNYLEKQQMLEMVRSVGVDARHLSVDELIAGCALRENRLFYQEQEVGIVYYRWLYNADQYSPEVVRLRTEIESSYAVPVPSVEVQIAGLKFFQQLLTNPAFLSQYSTHPLLKRSFVEFRTVSEYKQNPPSQPYVLKPLHEGGGNNFFGEEATSKLHSLSAKEAEGYILMEEIAGRVRKNRSLHQPLGDTIGEVGVFGYAVSSPAGEESGPAGYILRTKYSYSNEAGVSAGFGSLGTVALSVPQQERGHPRTAAAGLAVSQSGAGAVRRSG